MSSPRSRRSTLAAGLMALLTIASLVVSAQAATDGAYCSSQNTAPGNTYYNWPYQSNGNCTNHCNQIAPFAFAVLKWDDCWCSNYIPATTTDKSRCAKACPGFPDDSCGSKDDNLFFYLKLNAQPSGTAAGSQQTSTTVSTATLRPPSTPSTPTSTPAPASSSAVQSPTKPTSAPPSSTLQPQTSLAYVTESGVVVTKTVIQTPSAEPTTSSSSAPVNTGSGGGSSSVGAIVGGVLGGVLVLIAVVGGILFFLWRRRKQQREAHHGTNAAGIGGGSTGITRNTSTMSSAGLLGRGTSATSQYPPAVATNFGTANSRYGDQDSISPISNRRNSQPLVIDSRLNPKAVMTFANSNASRDSLASMDDSRDYGRQLNVRNPDP